MEEHHQDMVDDIDFMDTEPSSKEKLEVSVLRVPFLLLVRVQIPFFTM